MKIHKAELVISAVDKSQYPKDDLPEIALAGRSNVGKSSFINKMIGRKNLVHTSSKPGKTRTLNFYRINDRFYFVDVPGYGYAKVSKKEREKWGRMMEDYFETRKNLCDVVLIIDSRHLPTNDDLQMYEYATYLNIPLIIIATKVDKLSKNKWNKNVNDLKKVFHAPEVPIIPFSAVTGMNKDKVWSELEKYM
ncbi:MAG: YihA family ribosome biogenesis GTP-binding protein [Bacilli bacterium]|nr:YihA family ribosome biogenesis GTP-binding protein [Bacilli bacterium]